MLIYAIWNGVTIVNPGRNSQTRNELAAVRVGYIRPASVVIRDHRGTQIAGAGRRSQDDVPDVLLVRRQFTIDSDTEVTNLSNGVGL